MFNIFRKKKIEVNLPYKVDIHSHLLPQLDDGVKTLDESLEIISALKKKGISKIITTPHVLKDHYPNTSGNILKVADKVLEALKKTDDDITFEAAAEYYFDEGFMALVEEEDLLSFGKAKYLLIETSFFNEPRMLKEYFFRLSSNGYTPIFAHPERYEYLYRNRQTVYQLKDMNVKFQVNLGSLAGIYSPLIKKQAKSFLNEGIVEFLGSDCHNMNQFNMIFGNLDRQMMSMIEKANLQNDDLL